MVMTFYLLVLRFCVHQTVRLSTWGSLTESCIRKVKNMKETNYRKRTGKHQMKMHNGQPGTYTARVTSCYKDCLSRQVGEGVSIRRCRKEILNGKESAIKFVYRIAVRNLVLPTRTKYFYCWTRLSLGVLKPI